MGTTGTHAINVTLYPKLSYDPVKDFTAVTPAVLLPNLLVAHPSVPARSVKDLIALARARPGQLSYASSGNFLYLSGALFTSMARVEMLHVPFKGGAQAMPAVMSGEVALSFATIVSALPHAQQGRLRGLAVTSAERFRHGPGLSDRCGIGSAGLRGGRVVRRIRARGDATGLRAEVECRYRAHRPVARRARAVSQTGRDCPMRRARRSSRASCERDIAKWGKIVRESGAKPD